MGDDVAGCLLPIVLLVLTGTNLFTGNIGYKNGKNQAIITCNEQPKICQAQYQVLKFEEEKK